MIFHTILGKLVPFNWTLILYGTTSDPLENNGHVYNSTVGVVPKQRASNISGMQFSCVTKLQLY